MNRRVLSSALVVAALAAPAAGAETLISAEDPAAILEIAKGFGSAELTRDADGDPRITGRMAGTLYSIFFYQCRNGSGCENVQFSAGWSGYDVTAQQIHAWNRQALFGKAFLDNSGDPIVEMTVNLNHGVTRKNFDDTFDWWRVVVEDFLEDVIRPADTDQAAPTDTSVPI